MLILTRKEGERIMIGDDLIIKVLSMRRGQVSIGILAKKGTNIAREELLTEEEVTEITANAVSDHG